jgi:hypothetical protein
VFTSYVEEDLLIGRRLVGSEHPAHNVAQPPTYSSSSYPKTSTTGLQELSHTWKGGINGDLITMVLQIVPQLPVFFVFLALFSKDSHNYASGSMFLESGPRVAPR